jgi:hypothetical protein
VHELNTKDIAWSMLRPAQPVFMGNPRDPYDHIRLYLTSLVHDGHITEDDIPEVF